MRSTLLSLKDQSSRSSAARSHLINSHKVDSLEVSHWEGVSMDLTDEQWSVVSSIVPELPKRRDGRGRPWRCSRAVLNGILWILRTGAPWQDLPDRYPPWQTCHRRFQRWVSDGTLEHILHALAEDLHERGGLDLNECFIHFIDGMFVAARKEGDTRARPSGAEVRNSWQWQTALVFLSPHTPKVLRRTDQIERKPKLKTGVR